MYAEFQIKQNIDQLINTQRILLVFGETFTILPIIIRIVVSTISPNVLYESISQLFFRPINQITKEVDAQATKLAYQTDG